MVFPDGIRRIKPVIYFTVKGESKITVDRAHSMALALVYTLILKLTTITVSWYVLCSHQSLYLPFLAYDGRHSILYGSGLRRKLSVYSIRLHTSTLPVLPANTFRILTNHIYHPWLLYRSSSILGYKHQQTN